MVDVSIITVCMNRPDILFPCLDSLCAEGREDWETIVVAYLFSEENLYLLKERYPWVKIIISDSIRGFSENNNLALEKAVGKYCLIVNDDTVASPGLIDALVADIESLDGDSVAVSPKIVFPDGKIQTLGREPWDMKRYMKHYLHLVDETEGGPWSMKEGLFRTWTLNGACFLIETATFREAGWFDERFFFTPEDIALGQFISEAGCKLWADSRIEITHYAGGSVSSMERAIKPARVLGALEYYTDGSKKKRSRLATYIYLIEVARKVKYFFRNRKDPSSKNAIMYDTATNVMNCVFSSMTPKEAFISFMQKCPR